MFELWLLGHASLPRGKYVRGLRSSPWALLSALWPRVKDANPDTRRSCTGVSSSSIPSWAACAVDGALFSLVRPAPIASASKDTSTGMASRFIQTPPLNTMSGRPEPASPQARKNQNPLLSNRRQRAATVNRFSAHERVSIPRGGQVTSARDGGLPEMAQPWHRRRGGGRGPFRRLRPLPVGARVHRGPLPQRLHLLLRGGTDRPGSRMAGHLRPRSPAVRAGRHGLGDQDRRTRPIHQPTAGLVGGPALHSAALRRGVLGLERAVAGGACRGGVPGRP